MGSIASSLCLDLERLAVGNTTIVMVGYRCMHVQASDSEVNGEQNLDMET